MPLYLVKFSLTPEAWANLIKQPEDRREAVGRLLEAVGGKLHGFWYAFGDQDGYVLGEAPDNTAMASALVTVPSTCHEQGHQRYPPDSHGQSVRVDELGARS